MMRSIARIVIALAALGSSLTYARPQRSAPKPAAKTAAKAPKETATSVAKPTSKPKTPTTTGAKAQGKVKPGEANGALNAY